MKCFVVYEIATGIIASTGICDDVDLSAQAREGQNVLECVQHLNPNDHRVDLETGQVVSK